MIARGRGLVVEITDGVDERYRGSLYYDLAKSAVIRLARAQAEELRPHGIAAVAVSPGFLRSEAMLDHFGVTEATWRDAIATDRHFAASETPRFVARGIAALAADPRVMERAARRSAAGTSGATTASPTSTAAARTGARTSSARSLPGPTSRTRAAAPPRPCAAACDERTWPGDGAQEVLPRERVQQAVGDRDDRRRPRHVAQQRDLAEVLARPAAARSARPAPRRRRRR